MNLCPCRETINQLIREYGLQNQVVACTVGQGKWAGILQDFFWDKGILWQTLSLPASVLSDISDTTADDLKKTEFIVFPLAMVILCYVIGSIPLIILPALAMPCVILASYSVMYGVCQIMDVISFAPSVMLSLSVVRTRSTTHRCSKFQRGSKYDIIFVLALLDIFFPLYA